MFVFNNELANNIKATNFVFCVLRQTLLSLIYDAKETNILTSYISKYLLRSIGQLLLHVQKFVVYGKALTQHVLPPTQHIFESMLCMVTLQ